MLINTLRTSDKAFLLAVQDTVRGGGRGQQIIMFSDNSDKVAIISTKFRKNLKQPQWDTEGPAGGKIFMKKT
jgi:hypothetical protein